MPAKSNREGGVRQERARKATRRIPVTIRRTTKHEPTRLRLVTEAATCEMELPPSLPDSELINLASVCAVEANYAAGVLPYDRCVVWLGHPFKSGDFGAIELPDGRVYLGTLRHGPGGFVKLVTDRSTHTFRPAEYNRTGRAFSVERGEEVIRRF